MQHASRHLANRSNKVTLRREIQVGPDGRLSDVVWSWAYIQWLEKYAKRRETRTIGVGHAHAVILDETGQLSLSAGFPAGWLDELPALRPRDLGIELLLASPDTFTPEFTGPAPDELCSRLRALWAEAGEADRATILDLGCDPTDEDVLRD